MKAFRSLSWDKLASGKHGHKMSPTELDRWCEDDLRLFDTNAAVARVLEAAGIACHRAGDDCVTAAHEITDAVTEIEQWRNTNLLPVVQVRKRRGDVVVLEGYCARFAWGLRMRLITTGVRCGVGEVGARIDFIHKTVSRLPERRWFRSIAELISIGIEFTTEPGPDGQLLYHVHAHLIYRILRPVSKAKFRAFLQRWNKHFKGFHCPDSGRIRDLREACKYPCKSADLLSVLRSGELPQLYYQLEDRKLFQTYGGLRLLRADLRKNRETLRRRRLDAQDPEAVTSPQRPLIEYVRVGPQPTTRVRYGRPRDSGKRPTNIFLGWGQPFPDKVTGVLGVRSYWLNATLPPEKLRELRNLPRWTPPSKQHLNGHDEPPLQVHTSTSSPRLLDPDALPTEGEVSPFAGLGEHDADGYPLEDLDRDAPADDMGIPVLPGDPDEVFSTICSSPP